MKSDVTLRGTSQKTLLDFRSLPHLISPLSSALMRNFLDIASVVSWHQCHPFPVTLSPPIPRPLLLFFVPLVSWPPSPPPFFFSCAALVSAISVPSVARSLSSLLLRGPLSQSVFILPRGAIPVKPDDYLAQFVSPARGTSLSRLTNPALWGQSQNCEPTRLQKCEKHGVAFVSFFSFLPTCDSFPSKAPFHGGEIAPSCGRPLRHSASLPSFLTLPFSVMLMSSQVRQFEPTMNWFHGLRELRG